MTFSLSSMISLAEIIGNNWPFQSNPRDETSNILIPGKVTFSCFNPRGVCHSPRIIWPESLHLSKFFPIKHNPRHLPVVGRPRGGVPLLVIYAVQVLHLSVQMFPFSDGFLVMETNCTEPNVDGSMICELADGTVAVVRNVYPPIQASRGSSQ